VRKKILHTILISLEWRIIAFVITNIFFWFTTGHFWTAAGFAFMLQIILFLAYLTWYFLRLELQMSFSQNSAKKILSWW